jgi:peroxiredoxin Q/BCP
MMCMSNPQQPAPVVSEGARIGRAAPGFSLPSHAGAIVSLDLLRGRPVVVFFFPKAHSPGCTAEACSFRDTQGQGDHLGGSELAAANATILGVSRDSTESLRRFAELHRIGYLLLSDRDGALRRLWSVPAWLGVLPGRVTYILDRDLIVREIIDSQLRPAAHARRALAALRSIDAGTTLTP